MFSPNHKNIKIMNRFVTLSLIATFALAFTACTGGAQLAEKKGYTGAKKQCMTGDRVEAYCGGRYNLEDVKTINENNFLGTLVYHSYPKPDILTACWNSDMYGRTNCYMFKKKKGTWKVESYAQGSYKSFAYY